MNFNLQSQLNEIEILNFTANEYEKSLEEYVTNNFKMIGVITDELYVTIEKKGFFHEWKVKVESLVPNLVPVSKTLESLFNFLEPKECIVEIMKMFLRIENRISNNFIFVPKKGKQKEEERISKVLISDEYIVNEYRKGMSDDEDDNDTNIVQ